MKTHILRCESFDSIASLEDRLKWVKAGRVLLVMPEKDSPALSRQDFIRLKRKAGTLHADLGLVSQDATLRQTALSAGLPVFSSNEDARKEEWVGIQTTKPVKRRPEVAKRIWTYRAREMKPLPGWARWLAFGLAVLAILALISMLLPGVTVELNLPRQMQVREFSVIASESLDHPDLIDGIPLYKVTDEVSAQIDQKTSGKITVGDDPAEGLVIFINLTESVQEIPAGTIVRSLEPALRFEVKKDGSLPAGPETTITLPVAEMDGSGSLGNLPAGSIVAVDPPLGQFLSVSNPQALSGGTLTTVPALAEVDLRFGNIAFDQSLQEAFNYQAHKKIPETIVLLNESYMVEAIKLESTPPPYDRPLESFQIFKTIEMSSHYYTYNDLGNWGDLAFDTSLPPGIIRIPNSSEILFTADEYYTDGSARIRFIGSIRTVTAFDSANIAAQVRGLKPEEAINLIHTLIPGSQPVITLSPSWWPWLPFTPQRIEING
jgi:hypothetical protein